MLVPLPDVLRLVALFSNSIQVGYHFGCGKDRIKFGSVLGEKWVDERFI